MGFFKDIKDIGQRGKELGDHHGGMPSWKQGMSDFRAVTDGGGEREVLEKGEPANAKVLGFPLQVPGERFRMQVELEIQPESGPTWQVNYSFPTTRMNAPLVAGMVVPVKYLPDVPQRVAVHWEAQKANVAAQGGNMDASMKAMEPVFGSADNDAFKAAMAGQPGATPGQPAAAPAAAQTPEERLAKLDDLRSKGALSELEYQEKRKQIIAEL